jgi:hypothetical protein
VCVRPEYSPFSGAKIKLVPRVAAMRRLTRMRLTGGAPYGLFRAHLPRP